MRQPHEEAHPPQGIFVGGRRDLCPPAAFHQPKTGCRCKMAKWIDACATDDIEEEELIRFDHDGQTFAIYRSPK